MGKKSKVIAGLLAVTLGVAITATGCGSKKTAGESKSEGGATKISIFSCYYQTNPPAADSPLITELEKLTNTDLDFTWVPNSSYEDKMNVTLSSGDLPDIMVVLGKTPGFIKSANAGAFWDLTDYLKDYPNLSKADPVILNNSSVNGHVYGIYRRRDMMRTSVTIRKDWLDNLGLKAPETVDDLYNIAKAFTEDDPDGNGQNDTYGFVIPKWSNLNNSSPYDIASVWFGAPNAYSQAEDGTVTAGFETPEYLESLKWFRDMVQKGYVNPDFATLVYEDHLGYFIQGKGGIIIDTYSTRSNIVNKIGTEETDKMVTFTGNLKSPDGELYSYPTPGYSGMLVIPKSSVPTEERLKEILTFIDACSSKEGQILLNNGIESMYTPDPDDSRFAWTVNPDSDEYKLLNSDRASLAQIGTSVQADEYYILATKETQIPYKSRLDMMKSDLEHAVNNPLSSYVSDTYTSKGTTLDTIIVDARMQFISGQIDEQGWKDAIELWKKSGGEQVLTELAELSKKK